MSLHNSIDTVAYVSCGLYTATYGSAAQANVNNLYASLGMIEDAPDVEPPVFAGKIASWLLYLRRRFRR